MIKKENFHILNFIKKEEFSGSISGMRYLLKKTENGDEKKLTAVIWPEPYCYSKTSDELKQKREFAFDEQGLDNALDWLNEQYVQQNNLWNTRN